MTQKRTELAVMGANGKLLLHLHPGQQKAWDSKARFVAIIAGTQSGKTSFAPHWLYREIQRCGPGDYIFVTPTYPLLEMKALPELLKVFRQWMGLGEFVSSPRRLFRFSPRGLEQIFGSDWDLREAPDTRVLFGCASDPESLESATARAAVCDEAGQTGFKVGAWEAILRRLSLAQGRALITTSVYTLGWLKDKYDRWKAGDRDWEFINFDSTMNPSFPREEFERARRDLPRYKFEMLYRGRFSQPAGLIYDCFHPVQHRCPRFTIPASWPRYLGLDFGSKNTAAVFLAEEQLADAPATGERPVRLKAQDAGKRYYLYRTYHTGDKSVQGHVRELLRGEPGLARVVGGSPSEEEWRREWRAAGLPVRRPQTAAVEVGISRVYGMIQRGELMVFDDLAELYDELTTYSRIVNDEGQPTEEIDNKSSYHLLDALRYAASEIPGPSGQGRKLEARQVTFYR